MKKFWSYIKSKKADYSGVTSLKQEGKLITDPKQKSNTLNKQFQSVFSEATNITTSEFVNSNYMQDTHNYPVMHDITITPPGIEKLLSKLDPSKASGPDEIKPRLLKKLGSWTISNTYINFSEITWHWRSPNRLAHCSCFTYIQKRIKVQPWKLQTDFLNLYMLQDIRTCCSKFHHDSRRHTQYTISSSTRFPAI